MKNKVIMNCIVTYAGDITEKLKACGSQCPHRLTDDGNTEQMVECVRGGASSLIQIETLAKMSEPFIIQDCAKNGTVIRWTWVFAEYLPVKNS
jgi:hypothetical protein